MLIIFDIDGTLCDTHDVDTRCYIEAVESVTGHSLASVDWAHYTEATSAAIVHQLLSELGIPDAIAAEQRIHDEFVARLGAAAQRTPEMFQPIDGALELFEELRRKNYNIAIATGCWRESAKLKLHRSGFTIGDIPFASASDARRRADIIALAAYRAGFGVGDAVYVGDGLWDLKAARELCMRFIGVGKRHALLHEHGASRLLVSFAERAQFFRSLES